MGDNLNPTAVVTGIIGQVNPFNSIKPLLASTTQALIPYVDLVGSQTTGLIIGDGALAFYVTLMFMVSLILIVLSDRVNMTRSLRYTFVNVHFALLRATRCIVTVGLFFLGRRIGQAGDFASGYDAASSFIETTTLTWSLQKLIEYFSEVSGGGIAYLDGGFNPVFDRDTFIQTIMQVIYDYLLLYNNLVLNSMVGSGSNSNTSAAIVPLSSVAGASGAGNVSNFQLKTLFQMYDLNRGSQSIPQLQYADIWYYSPLFAGVVVGMFA